MRNTHAGQPFTTSDEEIAEALRDLSIPTLMLTLVHMSGDPTLIRGALKPAGLFLNEVQGYMSEDDKTAVRTIALEVIADYRDRGCPEPAPVGPALLKEMMEWLVRTPIAHIEPDAVVTEDGVRHPADVIAYATGFQANKALWPMTIIGRDGEAVGDRWGERPTAYLGITVPGYPNFFCMYGPGTNLASGGSLIFHSECQMRYIAGCLEHLIAGGHRSMEPRQDR